MNQGERLLIYLLAGALVTTATAWVAFQLQQDGIAPAVLFPLAVGAALGIGLSAVSRFVRLPGRRMAICGAVCWGLLAACAQDYIGHRYRLRLYDDALARQPLAAAAAQQGSLRPTFADHLADRWHREPVWWTLDLVLTAAAAGLVTAVATRHASAAKPAPPAADEPAADDAA